MCLGGRGDDYRLSVVLVAPRRPSNSERAPNGLGREKLPPGTVAEQVEIKQARRVAHRTKFKTSLYTPLILQCILFHIGTLSVVVESIGSRLDQVLVLVVGVCGFFILN